MKRKRFVVAPFMDGVGVYLVTEQEQHALYFIADCSEDSKPESEAVADALNRLYEPLAN